MEDKSKIVLNSEDDKTTIKQEQFNQIEVQEHNLLQNETCFEELVWNSNIYSKIGNKQEILDPDVESNDIKCDSPTLDVPLFIGTDAIKAENEIHIKEESSWYDGRITDSYNEEKENEAIKHEESEDTQPLETSRLPAETLIDTSSSTTVYAGIDATSIKTQFGNNVSMESSMRNNICSININPSCHGDHIVSDKNISNETTLIYKYVISEKSSAHNTSLETQTSLHSSPIYKCDKCQICFTQKLHLENHILFHSGRKQYKCEQCEKNFTQKAHLRTHILVHSGIKAHQCELCDKSFKHKSHLQAHTLLHLGSKPHKCEHCERSFTQKSNLQRHMWLHSGTKPYKCDHCDKCFRKKSVLKSHTYRHSDTKPFTCEHCGKFFIAKSNLEKHKLLHSDTNPYKCEFCQKIFRGNASLQKHKLIHSAIKALI